MGHVTYGDGIAIGQIAYYAPALLASLFVIKKHGVTKSSGWFFLTFFCIIRIVGAAARLITISKPDSNGAWTTSLICSALGLSPLFMATLGLLSRAYCSIISQASRNIFRILVFMVIHGPAMIAVGLCVAGATNAPTAAQIYHEKDLHAGYILYTLILVMLTALALGVWFALRKAGRGEGILVLAVICALPFLWVRLIYSLLAIFSHIKTFNMTNNSTGSESASLFMSVLEEMFVVLIYLTVSLKLAALPVEPVPATTGKSRYTAGRGDFGSRNRGLFSPGASAFQYARAARTDPEANEREKYGPGADQSDGIPLSHSQQRYHQAHSS